MEIQSNGNSKPPKCYLKPKQEKKNMLKIVLLLFNNAVVLRVSIQSWKKIVTQHILLEKGVLDLKLKVDGVLMCYQHRGATTTTIIKKTTQLYANITNNGSSGNSRTKKSNDCDLR